MEELTKATLRELQHMDVVYWSFFINWILYKEIYLMYVVVQYFNYGSSIYFYRM